MYLADYHVHSEFSSDSREKLENIFGMALKKGLKEIAITDHLDLDYPEGELTFMLDFERYVETLKEYREIYRKWLDIKIGVELGLQPHLKDNVEIKRILQSSDLDFIIGSTHVVEGMELDQDGFYRRITKDEAHERYFKTIYENVRAFEGWSVCGHLDFIKRYGGKYHRDHKLMDYLKHMDIIDAILKTIIDKGSGLEVNTSGYRYGLGEQSPCGLILKRYRELGGEIVTIGSDAHSAGHIAKDFDRAIRALKQQGFNYYSVFNRKKVEFKKII